jgi:exodeoxyribonuclease VII large subunit
MSLFELNEYIRRVLALNFQQPLWVAAEIAQCGQSRGHYYLTLIQKNEGEEIMAQAEAMLWAADYRRIRSALGPEADAVLQPGLQVRLQVRVEFHERYGLRLQINDLDLSYTFGQLELQRRQTLNTLRQQGLIGKNAGLQLPFVIQRMAVVSSADAAGFQDFKQHLQYNLFGYKIDFQLFATAVQGKNAVPEILEALRETARLKDRFDCVAILRGGGAKLDLTAFDDLSVCTAVAKHPLPVLSGIGHETDESILDHVAHRALKTPTAVADFVLQHNLFFEQEMMRRAQQAKTLATQIFARKQYEFEQTAHSFRYYGLNAVQMMSLNIHYLAEGLPRLAAQKVHEQAQKIQAMAQLCAAHHPEAVLRQGYTLTLREGKVLDSASDIKSGDVLLTRWYDGEQTSKVE